MPILGRWDGPTIGVVSGNRSNSWQPKNRTMRKEPGICVCYFSWSLGSYS